MASEVVMGVEGIESPESVTEAVNALYKYSGVLEVDVSPSGDEVRVRYDPGNVIAEDLKESLRQAGFRVNFVRR